MRIFAFAAAMLAATHAHAQSSNAPHYFTLAPGTYAVRSLCPVAGIGEIDVYLSDGNTVIARNYDRCVNGRLGVTFTVPALQRINVTTPFDRAVADIRLALNRDCPEDVSTTCTLRIAGQGRDRIGTAAGVITYPGDQDWIRLPDDILMNDVRIAAPAGCFASGKVHEDGERAWLEVLGGPSACTYQVTARRRPEVE